VDLTDRFAARHDEVTCLHALTATNVMGMCDSHPRAGAEARTVS
jgi:hypothetical protein